MSHDCGPARREANFTLRDLQHGKVNVRIIDRISVDDVVLHLVERELFRLAGGDDPGVDLSQDVIDFLVRERFIQV